MSNWETVSGYIRDKSPNQKGEGGLAIENPELHKNEYINILINETNNSFRQFQPVHTLRSPATTFQTFAWNDDVELRSTSFWHLTRFQLNDLHSLHGAFENVSSINCSLLNIMYLPLLKSNIYI